MRKIVYVNGRKIIEKEHKWIVLDKVGKELTFVMKTQAKTSKEAVAIYLEREDNKYVNIQDKVWRDYV